MSNLEYSNAPLSYLKVGGKTVRSERKVAEADRETKAETEPTGTTDWHRLYRNASPRNRERILSLWNAKPEHRSEGSL
jgi:hypothetical protein